MSRRLPAPIRADLRSLTPELPPEVFSSEFQEACSHLDTFTDGLLVELRETLDLPLGEALAADTFLPPLDCRR